MKKIAIVGAGFSGAVIARELAEKNYTVTVFENREQVGGNSYSYVDKDTGITVHKYGPHIFHTDNERAWEYITRFCTMMPYINRVKSAFSARISIRTKLKLIKSFFKGFIFKTDIEFPGK